MSFIYNTIDIAMAVISLAGFLLAFLFIIKETEETPHLPNAF